LNFLQQNLYAMPFRSLNIANPLATLILTLGKKELLLIASNDSINETALRHHQKNSKANQFNF